MNISEVLRRLKMNKDEFFPLVKELGFDVGERAIKIDDRVVTKIMLAIKNKQRLNKRTTFFVGEKSEQENIAEVSDGKRKVVELPETITVKAFADKLGRQVIELVAILLKNGIMATINENIDFETATIIAQDMGYETLLVPDNKEMNYAQEQELKIKNILDAEVGHQDLIARPPVIVVMGHVDHGKTKLLDAIRQTNIVDQEAGGITQSIGAYQVKHKDRLITFIDTPGHEAFTAMRSRGANIADMAILVVAADDGIKPQTIEAIEIIGKAQLSFVVAINKIDKEAADIDKVKKDLSELNLVSEDWGGKTICVPISAKQNTNIDELLDMVLLAADLEQQKMLANPKRLAVGTIIESKIDKDSGPVATVLVQTGTLRVGDLITVGTVVGKIKAMKDWRGNNVLIAGPSMPVRFLGLKGAPVVGDILQVTTDKKVLKNKQKQYSTFGFLQNKKKEKENKKSKLNLIVKADTLGSLEAIINSLNKIQHEEVELSFVNKGLGNITEKDIAQAEGGKALIIGFNVGLTPTAQDNSHGSGVVIKTFKIIYELIDFAKDELETLLPPEIIYNQIGSLKTLAIFKKTNKFNIMGGKVISGVIKDKALVKIFRDGKKIGEGIITQLQSNKKNTNEVATGNECGLQLETVLTIEKGDLLEIYEKEEKKRKLA